MNEIIIYSIPVLLIILIIINFLIIQKINKRNDDDFENKFEDQLAVGIDKIEKGVKDEVSRSREEFGRISKDQREELSNSFKLLGDQITNRMNDIADKQKGQLNVFSERLEKLIETNEQKFDKLQGKIEERLKEIENNNSKKLEEMRQTVDEKLHETLEKRLGESFKVVSSQLKSVYEGLGEMQKLATGVGDLKRVLTNVKTRGTWGEVQLEKLIEQILTPDQYAKNVKTKSSGNALVEFAIKMPGSQEDKPVWIPVDAKFPLEDYQRLMDAQETVNLELIADTSKAIERRIKQQAKDIQEKYLDPPFTTDFAIMFLPFEGLYAEVLRIPGLFDFVQREHRVTLTGPTNFLAVLNSLQMGFRTLAIQKRSSDIWKILGGVKTEFSKFGDILEKTQKKLTEASNNIGDATRKTRTIERRLRDVQELPEGAKTNLIEEDDSED
jgi:DNA recombination protein RmuC